MSKLVQMKSSVMSDKVRAMIELRHGAEQRGNFEPLGRLQWLQTDRGIIRFPVLNSETGEGCGPDIAYLSEPHEFDCADSPTGKGLGIIADANQLIVLGRWQGFPSLRVNTSKPCPKCRHRCDVCMGKRKKLCELCGGRTRVPGDWMSCPGPGCHKETGQYLPDCVTCLTSEVRGQIRGQRTCKMCEGTGQMTCSRCAGTGLYSTGRVNGAVDWDVSPKCKACGGTTYRGKWVPQDVKKFSKRSVGEFFAVGIDAFSLTDYRTSSQRIFDVRMDADGRLLTLLVPASPRRKLQKAYLIGGVVREREMRAARGA